MDKKENLYDPWAIADKPLLDKMKRTQQLSSDVNNKDSSDENSDQESDSNDSLALPQQFRPNRKIDSRKETRDGNTSLNQTKIDRSIQNSASDKPTNNLLEKRTFHSSTNQNLSLRNGQENLFNNISSVKDLEDKKESILRYGKEISDLIIGSYRALTIFISFYRKWAFARKELIHRFEELKQQLKESSTMFSRLWNILNLTNAGAAVASAIPHPVASVAGRVATMVSGLLQKFLNNKREKSDVDSSDEMTTAVLKDNRASYDLYMYGLQCSQQFEETTKLIEEFHLNAAIQGFFDRENPEITTFILGFLEYKPNHQIFYKKLHKCFQELLQSSKTNFSRTFCEPFTLYSLSAVDVIGHLRWRFRNEDFDGSSVRYELEEIHRLFQNSSSININDLQKRIQTCIGILTDELEFVESIMKDFSMFDSCLDDRSEK